MTQTNCVLAAIAAATLVVVFPLGANAETPSRIDVRIVAQTSFESASSPFESTLPSCESGTVTDERPIVRNPPPHGVFTGVKHFECDSGSSLDIKLSATFNEAGSAGRWSVVGGTGDLASVRGSGKLAGVPFDDGTGITDVYVGSVVAR